jgi:hypothetical protein
MYDKMTPFFLSFIARFIHQNDACISNAHQGGPRLFLISIRIRVRVAGIIRLLLAIALIIRRLDLLLLRLLPRRRACKSTRLHRLHLSCERIFAH